MHLLLAVVAIAAGAAPSPCNPSQTYEAHGRFEFKNEGGDKGMGDYHSAHSVAMKKRMVEGKADEARHEKESFWMLEDFATEKRYAENSTTKMCDKESINGTLPNPWSWVAHATFSGSHIIRNRTLNIFTYRPTPAHVLEIGCFAGAETIPVEEHFKEPGHEMRISYHNFTSTVNADMFKLKPNCQA